MRKELFFEKWNVGKFLLVCGVFLLFVSVFSLKVAGATSITSDVEKNGYCKISYGEEWKNIRGENICRHKLAFQEDIEPITFSEEDFREVCPQHKFLSPKIYSDCFRTSGSIV